MKAGTSFDLVSVRVEAYAHSNYGGDAERFEAKLVGAWGVGGPHAAARRAVYVPTTIDPGARLFLAQLADAKGKRGAYVGCAAVLTGPSILSDVLFAGVAPTDPELSQVWVDERYRRCGVADELVAAALAWSDREGGARHETLGLVCAPWFQPWYERHGFARSTFCGKPFPEVMHAGQKPFVHMFRDRPGAER